MTRLIDADALWQKVFSHTYPVRILDNENKVLNEVLRLIDNAPSVENRPHGEWIEVEPHQSDLEEGIDYREECSICHEPNRHYGLDKYYNISFVTYYKTNFCPNCGADMREADND